jgi:hypothetical protein
MRRPRIAVVAVALLAAGLVAAGCGSSSASPPSTTAAPATNVTPREWLTTNAAHWTARLNGDQTRVAAAAAATSGQGTSAFFTRLTSVCTKLADDARQAMNEPKAPAAGLQYAWHAMLSATETYASKCLALAHSNSTAAVNEWQTSLTSMNNANDTFNNVANAAAKPASGASTTTSTASTTTGSSH